MNRITLFEYQRKQVRTVFIGGEIWFVARDVVEALGIVWKGSETLASVKQEWTMTPEITDSLNRPQKTLCVNEAGVYKLAFRSNKPEAERFTDWIAGEVIPQIRKTGRYVAQSNPIGILPLASHTSEEIQKTMSKVVNGFNIRAGGRELAVRYNVLNALAHTGKTPSALIKEGKKAGLKSKDYSSGKAVARVLKPSAACCMSLADNLREQNFEPEKVFEVTKKADEVFKGMLALGATPSELNQK